MGIVILSAKAVVAVILLFASGAKFADPTGFLTTARLFLPKTLRSSRFLTRLIAIAVPSLELLFGLTSLSFPWISALNYAILILSSIFVGLALIGYTFHRGWSCRCFGALSQRKFDATTILRNAGMLCLAILAILPVSPTTTRTGAGESGLLIAGATVIVASTFSASRGLAAARMR